MQINTIKFPLVFLTSVILFYLILKSYLTSTQLRISVRIINDTIVNYSQNNRKLKYILQRPNYWGEDLCFGDDYQGCPVETCYTTNDSELMPIDKFDAIIYFDVWGGFKLPKTRNINQKYILYSVETPVKLIDSYRNNFYNWSISYRKDADILFPFGTFEKKENPSSSVSLQQVRNKTKFVTWLVSDCVTAGVKYRMRYVKELEKHIPVDVYGKCGTMKCPGKMSLECYNMLDANYKFYIAFENSFCKDYISEKIYNIMKYTNMIPIVAGFGDYEKNAPPNSFIHSEDFESPKHLAEYLKYLDTHEEEHMKYLAWKGHYNIKVMDEIRHQVCCDLCKKLHEPVKYSWYVDFKEWAWGKNKSFCYTGEEFRYRGNTSLKKIS